MADELNLNLFPNSNMPAGKGALSPPAKHDASRMGEVTGVQGQDGIIRLNFPSLSAAGRVNIVLPLQDKSGFFKTESLQARDLGTHILAQVDRAWHHGPAAAKKELSWYAGCCKGGQFLDDFAQARFSELSHQFASASEPEAFFDEHVEPFLSSLTPKAR